MAKGLGQTEFPNNRQINAWIEYAVVAPPASASAAVIQLRYQINSQKRPNYCTFRVSPVD